MRERSSGVEEGRGRFLQHLLVAALGRAFAFVEVDRVAVRIAEHLDLDVARGFDVAFQQHAVAAEGVPCFALAAERGSRLNSEPSRTMRMPLPPPPCAALIISGKPMRSASRAAARDPAPPGIARHHRHTCGGHQFLGAGLGTHLAHRRGPGPMKTRPAALDRIGEVGVLGKKAVARMDRLRAGLPRRIEDGLATQVGFCRSGPPMATAIVEPGARLFSGIASEYTATVRMPSCRQVRITRQAISPRLAIRTQSKGLLIASGLAGPVRATLAEEGIETFLALGGEDRSRRRPTGARWRSRDGPALVLFAGSAP
jgi:hypothetical protein